MRSRAEAILLHLDHRNAESYDEDVVAVSEDGDDDSDGELLRTEVRFRINLDERESPSITFLDNQGSGAFVSICLTRLISICSLHPTYFGVCFSSLRFPFASS